jgi:hypothetical protein
LIPEVRISRQARLSLVVVLAKGPDQQETMSPSTLLRILGENSEDAYGFPPYRSLEGFLSRDGDLDYHGAETDIVREGLREATGIRLASEHYRWWKRLPSLLRPGDSAAAETIPSPRTLAGEHRDPG